MQTGGPIWVNVPGAALSFAVGADGSLAKLLRLETDFSSAYGVSLSPLGAVVADRQGGVALFGATGPGLAPELRWRRDLGSRVLSVSSSGDRVWAATFDGELVALRSPDGAILWSTPIEGRAEAPAAGTEKDVFVATKSSALLRIDAATGVVRWKAALSGPVIHPPVLAERESLVLCGTWGGTLTAFKTSSGDPQWSVALPGKLASPPVASSDRVAEVTDDGTVHAHDLRGRPVWRAAETADGPASLFIVARPEGGPALLVVSRRLAALDLATGERLDSFPEGAERELQRRFFEARIEGERTYAEAEKSAALEREAFSIPGPLFGAARMLGGGIAFGTEDGWVYLFHAATLRPTYRYRAGQAVTGLPRLAAGRLVAAAGDEVFGLAPETGEVLWRRGVGGAVRDIDGGRTLVVLTGERLSALDARDGSRGWTQRTRTRFVSASPRAGAPGEEGDLWLIEDGAGRLQALDRTGREVASLASGGTLLRPVPLAGESAWAAATREGRVFALAWVGAQPASGAAAPGAAPAGRLELVWEHSLDAPVSSLSSAGGVLLARLEGSLASLASGSGREIWRLPLLEPEDVVLAEEEQAFLVFGADTVRMYDLRTGEIRFAREARPPAVGVVLRGRKLRWLDRSGRSYAADVVEERLLEAVDLGVGLEGAVPTPEGFLIKTSAGEIGVVSAGRRAAAAAPELGPTD
jgi:outer membrane protein assembly factor BamB